MPSARSLSPGTVRILHAVVAAIRPRGHGFDQPIDADVLRDVQAFFPFLPPALRFGLPVGLRLVEFGPPLFARRWTRFTAMPAEDAQAYLASFAHAGGLRGALYLGLRALVFLAFYQHPDVLRSMGIDWAGRAVELTRRRADLLDEHVG